MYILSFFSENGIPSTGLSPIVDIIDVSTGTYTVISGSMDDIGSGFYRYDFTTYSGSGDYAIICDSVTLSGTDRYVYSSSGEYGSTISDIESYITTLDLRTTLLRKLQTNRLELSDGSSDNWILYDDDESTPLLTFSVSDKSGGSITQSSSVPSKRGMAAGDIV